MLRLALAGAIALVLSSAALAAPKMPGDMCAAPLDPLKSLIEADPTFIADHLITDPDATTALTEILRKAGETIPDGITGYLLLDWSDVGVVYMVVWDNCLRRGRGWPDGLASPFPPPKIESGHTSQGDGA